MSDTLIQSLNARISTLEGEKANLNAALKQERNQRKALSAEAEELRADLDEALNQRDDFETRAKAGPEDLTKRIGELEGQISGRDHKDAFRAAAATAGVDPKYADDLYQLLGLKAGDKPADARDFADPLAAAKEARPWAFGGRPESAGGIQPPPKAGGSQGTGAATPPPGSGRSASGTTATTLKYTREQITEPGWQQTRPDLAQALIAGNAEMVVA